MARLPSLLLVAAACVVTSPVFGDKYDYDDHHGGKGGQGDWGEWSEWGEVQGAFSHVAPEVTAIVKIGFTFLVKRGVPAKKAMAHALRGTEVMLQVWGKILHKDFEGKFLHKDYDFHDDLNSLNGAKLEAHRTVPWIGNELQHVDKHYPGILDCVLHTVTHLVGSLTGGHGHGGLAGGLLGGGHGGLLGGGGGHDDHGVGPHGLVGGGLAPAHGLVGGGLGGAHGLVGGGLAGAHGVVGGAHGLAGGHGGHLPLGGGLAVVGKVTGGHMLDDHDGYKKESYGAAIGAGLHY